MQNDEYIRGLTMKGGPGAHQEFAFGKRNAFNNNLQQA